jgi:hypothetical protein
MNVSPSARQRVSGHESATKRSISGNKIRMANNFSNYYHSLNINSTKYNTNSEQNEV